MADSTILHAGEGSICSLFLRKRPRLEEGPNAPDTTLCWHLEVSLSHPGTHLNHFCIKLSLEPLLLGL